MIEFIIGAVVGLLVSEILSGLEYKGYSGHPPAPPNPATWPYCRRSHRMKLVKDTGPNLYYECECGERKVKHRLYSGYQPIDKQWLEDGR